MKYFTLTSLLLLLAIVVNSQIPNAGFENWTTVGSYEVPDEWGNMNAVTASSNVFTTVKGSPGSPGDSFIKLTTKNINGVNTPGVIVSGQLNTTTLKAESGFPFNQQVKNLTGRYQFMGYSNDSATIAAWLTRWDSDSQRRDTVASLMTRKSGMMHAWANFSLPFVYFSDEVPDTAIIYISSSGQTPQDYSFIWIDNLNFEGLVTSAQEEVFDNNMIVFPSPTTDQISISFTSKSNYATELLIIDMAGNIVQKSVIAASTGQNLINLTTLNMARGVYLLQLNSPSGVLSKKIVIR